MKFSKKTEQTSNKTENNVISKQKFKKSFQSKNGKDKIFKNLPSNTELNSEGKPNWSKLKAQAVELKKARKLKKNENYDEINQVKHMWEKLRVKKMDNDKRTNMINEVLEILKNSFNKILLSHDGTRIIQTLIKFGTDEQRHTIFTKMKSNILEIAQSSYAFRTLIKCFKYGSKELKSDLIKCFYGNIIKLLSNAFAYKLVEIAFIYANKEEKIAMSQEFYGDLYKSEKDKSADCLEHVLNNSPTMKDAILSSTKTNIIKLLNKHRHDSTFLHSIIEDYLKYCKDEDRDEILTLIRPEVEEYIITKQSVFVGMMCIWHSNKKERKQIIKSLKGSYKKIAFSNDGRFLIQALFDCFDDTVTVSKIMFPEILSDLKEFVNNEYGRKVLLYIIAHRDPRFFNPDETKLLKMGDTNKISKKPMDQRISELKDYLNKLLINAINEDIAFWMQQTNIALITVNVLITYKGENLGTAYENLAKLILDKNLKITNQKDSQMNSYIEHPGIHKILRQLIKYEAQVEKDDEEKILFSNIVIQQLNPEIILWLLSFNRGCLFLINLLDCNVTNSFKITLAKVLKKSPKESSKFTGMKLLKEKLIDSKKN